MIYINSLSPIGKQPRIYFSQNEEGNSTKRVHTKARLEKYSSYPDRFPVPSDKTNWETVYPEYNPTYFTDSKILAKCLDVSLSDTIDPEDISKKKAPVEINNVSQLNEKNFDEDMSGSDLDIPGSELDDEFENSGNEDEENNHYSIGGDSHSNLDENTGNKD